MMKKTDTLVSSCLIRRLLPMQPYTWAKIGILELSGGGDDYCADVKLTPLSIPH